MELLLWAGVALLQLLALPGWLLVRSLRLDRDGPLQTALYSFGLSLLLNHLLVVALVVLGVYTRPVLLGVLALELGLLALTRRLRKPAAQPRSGPRLRERLARDGAPLLWAFLAVATTGFLLSLRVGTLPYLDPVVPYSPMLFAVGVMLMFLSAAAYETLPPTRRG